MGLDPQSAEERIADLAGALARTMASHVPDGQAVLVQLSDGRAIQCTLMTGMQVLNERALLQRFYDRRTEA